jgi:flagellar biosynthetic protein FliQ
MLLDLWRSTLVTLALVGAPFVLCALAVGVVMSLVQAATQLQENALSFVPKIAAIGLVMALAGPWVLERLVAHSRQSFSSIVEMAREDRP